MNADTLPQILYFLCGTLGAAIAILVASRFCRKIVRPRLFVHVKSKGIYKFIHVGRAEQTPGQLLVAYQGSDGIIWHRDHDEFFDGRFVELTDDNIHQY